MKDEVNVKGKKWEFDEDVTQCFDDMLERSIPDYENMRNLCFTLGQRFVKQNTNIVDIGCSNGLAIYPFIKKNGACNHYKLYDVSKPMLEACKEKYSGYVESGLVEVAEHDLREGIGILNNSVVLSILTIQFTPIEYRQKIIESIYNSLNEGGAFIYVEKLLGNTNKLDSVFVDEYYNIKKEHSYTQEQIQDKRKSLEGVLVPITENWNIELLKSSGFKQIDCFWRYLNFAGFIAIK